MRVCIICHKEVGGKKAVKVREDNVIRGIRRIKKVLRIAKNNELYVCEDCLEEHTSRRRSFEKSMLFFGIIAALVILVFGGLLLISGRFDIGSFVSLLILGALLLSFSIIFKFVPAIESTKPVLVKKKRGGMK